MLYRKYGKTNEMVSALGFGCMRLPILDKDPTKIDKKNAANLIRHAIDSGVNYVDTAYPYHGTGFTQGGASELFVGEALQEGYRERVKLATKLPSWLIKTRSDMDRYLNEQLQRLQTDHIDFYLVHALNKGVWPKLKELGIGEFLDQAIQDGRIRYAGFSFHDQVEVFKEIVDSYDWSFCQIQYNYLDEEYQAGTEGLKYAAKKGLGIAVMEPLRGGNLVNLPHTVQAVFDQAEIKRTPAEWALRWAWNHPEVSVVLSGMNAMEQVAENLNVAQDALPNSLTAKEAKLIDEAKKLLKEKIKVDCTACGYCMPCPAGLNIPGFFACYNDYSVFDGTPAARQLYGIFTKLSTPASGCVACGICETHCPQGINIREELKGVKELFEQ